MTKVARSAQTSIGNRLKDIRVKYFSPSGETFSIAKFAEKIGENGYNIANYEAGKAGIPNSVLSKIYLLGFNINWLITGEGKPYLSSGNNAAFIAGGDTGDMSNAEMISAVKACAGDIATIISRRINENR